MHRFVIYVLGSLVVSVSAAPFVNFPLGGDGGIASGGILSKVKDIGAKVHETKRNFLNGINEKVSNLLWIPPLPSATTAAPTYVALAPTGHINHDPPTNTHEQLISPTDERHESEEEPYLAIYARSSFLSPEDLLPQGPVVSPTEKPNVTVNVSNYFNLFGKSG